VFLLNIVYFYAGAILYIPTIDLQLDVLEKVEKLQQIEEKLGEAIFQFEDSKRSYFSLLLLLEIINEVNT
jgi:hypothetical protein